MSDGRTLYIIPIGAGLYCGNTKPEPSELYYGATACQVLEWFNANVADGAAES